MKEYRKNYRPLVLWSLALLPVMIGVATLAEKGGTDERGMIAVMMITVMLMLILLMWMIWKGEYVYWISGGPSFEEAKAADREVRREFAWRHFTAMLRGELATTALLLIEYALGAHEIVMALSVGAGIVASAISMIGIKWEDK